MILFAIETSCDETAVAILEKTDDQVSVLAHELYSQVEDHAEYGGVYPSLAKRLHAKNLLPLLSAAIEKAGLETASTTLTEDQKETINNHLEREPELAKQTLRYIVRNGVPAVDKISVTTGPGLEPALWVGITFAQALGAGWNVPVSGVNHMEGHIASVTAPEAGSQAKTTFSLVLPELPSLALLVSGGHTELVRITSWGKYEKIGQTRDDAAGEAFDKTARLLGLPYPGGPEISRLAEQARAESKEKDEQPNTFELPRPMIDSDDLDFSFSGLKTAVMYRLKDRDELTEDETKELAQEFEDAVVEVLTTKTERALSQFSDTKSLILAGGVAANKPLRQKLANLADMRTINFHTPPRALATDNAVMIGLAQILKEKSPAQETELDLVARGRLSL